MRTTRQVPPLVLSLFLLGASACQTPGQQQTGQQQPVADSAVLRSAVSETEATPRAIDRPPSVQERADLQRALDLWVEGLVEGDADRIPLDSTVIFVRPDGSTESTLKGITTIAPFIERQSIDDIQVRRTIIDGEYGCALTEYFWTEGPKMPVALCLRVVEGKITEIRPYFDRSLFDG